MQCSWSTVLSGRKAQLLAWKREFAVEGRTIYTRMPPTIEASSIAPIAMEYGDWNGTSLSGRRLPWGTYAAKWREAADIWVIEAELFLTLA